MDTLRNLATFRPSQPYLDSLDWILRSGNPEQLRQGVGQIVKRASQTRDLAHRKRLWFDAVHLLSGDWTRDLKPDLLDRIEIAKTRTLLAQAKNIPEGLEGLTSEVAAKTWESFSEFQSSPQGRYTVDHDAENWLGEFHQWLEEYLPCLMTKLPLDADAAESELRKRIDWMVDKAAPADNDPIQYREGLLDKCWTYVRAQWADLSQGEPQIEVEGRLS